MTFIHRVGIVLYWLGYALAILFAIVSLLIALKGLISGGGAISGAWGLLAMGMGHKIYVDYLSQCARCGGPQAFEFGWICRPSRLDFALSPSSTMRRKLFRSVCW
jgi:hypothetical protein